MVKLEEILERFSEKKPYNISIKIYRVHINNMRNVFGYGMNFKL